MYENYREYESRLLLPGVLGCVDDHDDADCSSIGPLCVLNIAYRLLRRWKKLLLRNGDDKGRISIQLKQELRIFENSCVKKYLSQVRFNVSRFI